MNNNIPWPKRNYKKSYQLLRRDGGDTADDELMYIPPWIFEAAQESYDNKNEYLSGWTNLTRECNFDYLSNVQKEDRELPF